MKNFELAAIMAEYEDNAVYCICGVLLGHAGHAPELCPSCQHLALLQEELDWLEAGYV